MNRKSQAQEIAVIRISRDTRISDASGVKSEAPKGGRFRFLATKRPGH